MTQKFNSGDFVKFSTPQNQAEKNARFIVVEEANIKGLVSIRPALSRLAIPPTESVHESELAIANPQERLYSAEHEPADIFHYLITDNEGDEAFVVYRSKRSSVIKNLQDNIAHGSISSVLILNANGFNFQLGGNKVAYHEADWRKLEDDSYDDDTLEYITVA